MSPFRLESLERRVLLAIPGTSLGIYHTYAQATADLNTIAAAYASLTQLVSIGKTVQNRDIWAIQVTDNPGVDEDEPEFFYQGSMHGDEPVGMEMNFYFTQYLLENYGSDTRVTNLVNSTDIWIVPNMNWDGYSRAGGAWRWNANGVDLNRNFPEWTTTSFSSDTEYFGPYGNVSDGPAPQTALLQAETVAIMDFRKAHRFVASANFHTGDLVVNYPWDSNGNFGADYAACPDDALFRQISLEYSLDNPPMSTSPGFDQGTTNGDNWYPISGGEQDWAYIYTGANEVTIELSFTKFPGASTLPTHWNNNRESMLSYAETVHWGVRGLITSSVSGLPLSAKINVIGPAPSPMPSTSHPSTHPTFSDPDAGDYHRMLLPGTYTIEFSSPGYVTQTISNVAVNSGATSLLNVTLVPVDFTPPTVSSWDFDFDAAAQSLRAQFSEDVALSLVGSDLSLLNLTTGSPVESISSLYDPVTNVASFSFAGLLADGNYRATLAAGSVSDGSGNPLGADATFDFYTLAGDANRDRVVDITDLGILASNWQQSPRPFSLGDFNYDHTVDITDLGMLATNWQKDLPSLAPRRVARLPRRPVRIIADLGV